MLTFTKVHTEEIRSKIGDTNPGGCIGGVCGGGII